MATSLKLYYDPLSQPSRAIWIFLKVTNIPFEEKVTSIIAGEHKTEEYKKVHPFSLVPAIDHNGFVLTESVAILKYLSDKFSVPDHWHPKDLALRARIDEYLAWQHSTLRKNSTGLFRAMVVTPLLTGKSEDAKVIEGLRTDLNKTLDDMETIFLKDRSYLATNDITIADIHAVCEIIQNTITGFEPGAGRPKLKAWMERVIAQLGPYYGQIHQGLIGLGQNLPKSTQL